MGIHCHQSCDTMCKRKLNWEKNPLYNRVAVLMKSWIQQCQHKENVKVKSERQIPQWTSISKIRVEMLFTCIINM